MEMMMSSWPQKETHAWSDLVVGGSAGEPLIFKLYETALISNGSFEEALSGWDGSGVRSNLGSGAVKGNYALVMEDVEYNHTYFDRTSPDNSNEMDSILFTGFIKATEGIANGEIKVRVYCDNGTARVVSPAKYVDLEIAVDDDSMVADVDGLTQWVKFYLMADISGMTGTNVHFEISCTDYTNIDYYLDDLKVHEVKEVLQMECPQTLRLNWQRKTDANYDMEDGTNKDYVKGWRPIFALGYEFCSRAELIRHIGVSENSFNFFAPHKDSINGEYVRIIGDFDSNYFHDKFLGHSHSIQLRGIYLRKNKNIEYDSDYFTLTEV
jgi:hypothetical protein